MLVCYEGQSRYSILVKKNSPSHVIATFLQFNHRSTTITALPTGLLCCFEQSIRFLIFRTVFRAMPFAITHTADFGLATTASPNFLSILLLYILRFDPLPTPSAWTIDAILG